MAIAGTVTQLREKLLARICLGSTQFDRFTPGTVADEAFSLERPLETTVERRPIRWGSPVGKLSLDLRLALGRRWRKMLASRLADSQLTVDYWPAYLLEYMVAAPDPAALADAHICAHADVWQQFGAAAGRAMDGFALLEHIAGGGAAADTVGATPGDAAVAAAPVLSGNTFIPVSLVFSGMPNTRWWEFEERRTNFGQVTPDTPEIGKLLLLEFGLVYANDWFVFPHTLPIGSVARVQGIALTNVFGERIWIEPVRSKGEPAWDRWSMFQLTGDEQSSDLVLLPSTPFVMEGTALEEVALVRDEMANLVFGIERHVPMASGISKPGGEAGRELLQALTRIQGAPPPPAPVALVRYQLMNTVPEHWIPFLPMHVPGSSRETQMQRGAMPRMLGPSPADLRIVEPRTSLLRPGLDATPRQSYFVYERPLHNRENLAVVTEKNIQTTVIARHLDRKRSFFPFFREFSPLMQHLDGLLPLMVDLRRFCWLLFSDSCRYFSV